MYRRLGLPMVILALVYVILPWDFDYVPFVGRIDDLLLLALALFYFWRGRRRLSGAAASSSRGGEQGAGEAEPEALPDPYRVLGIGPEEDLETVKRKYRELLRKYHPDRVQHLGEEFREIAQRRTREINAAYEAVLAAADRR